MVGGNSRRGNYLEESLGGDDGKAEEVENKHSRLNK
jgi:hypothetical protein